MTGAVVLALAVVTVAVLGTSFVQAVIVLSVALAHVAWVLLCGLMWLGSFAVAPRQALASLRDAIAAAEAESAIRRLNT
jgi:hypothetical protein